MMDLGEAFLGMQRAVCRAQDAGEAWAKIIAVGQRAEVTVPAELKNANSAAAVTEVQGQLHRVIQAHQFPAELTYLYFGLFDAAGSGDEIRAGFYVAGGESDGAPDVDNLDLTWLPVDRFLECSLLRQVKAAASRSGDDYNFYGYAVMFGAAAMLAKFSLRALALKHRLVVGFDSGDRVIVT